MVVQQSTEIIDEMLINERNYVEELSIGIESYLTAVRQADVTEIYDIFEIIEQIKDYHKDSFCVFLKDCETNVSQIATIFLKCMQVRMILRLQMELGVR